ncbi:unnamed protein product [Spirodela intermedia]|uniref:SPARK domain-containing protein n=1 Tax=Spirodela intermedia TaxID=51605 RepID=A0A7I8LJT6_SPIIN|nr:unnamed protein product [Spirodela intermedia]
MRMWSSTSLSLLFFFLLSTNFCTTPWALIDRPFPAQPFVSTSSGHPSTIPAFPEQSDFSGSCPLDLPQDLLSTVSHACSSSAATVRLSRSRCCPPLAAWLYAAYSATALAGGAPAASSRPSDMPLLPEDSEACAGGVEKALRARGLDLRPVNVTCDVATCFCGVRLRPFSCSGSLAVERDAAGRWVAGGAAARRIERDCALPGPSGCSRCLHSLYQLQPAAPAHGGNETGGSRGPKLGHAGDCELLGITWLLARNRTLYLPAITGVLRALLLAAGDGHPLSCTVASDGKPLAVDSADLDDSISSSARPLLFPAASLLLLLLPPAAIPFFLS